MKEYEYKSFIPYRVCPLGAHIDHQLGKVTSFAIDKGINIEYNATDNGYFYVKSDNFIDYKEFYLNDMPSFDKSWSDYLIGSILALREDYEINCGIDAHILPALPSGGIASSSSIIIAYILAIAKVNNIKLEEKDLISLVVKVENYYLNTKVGILDPSSEVYAKKNSLLYLDTKKNTYKLVKPKKEDLFKICLIYSGVSRRLTNTYYNIRVDECKSVAFYLNSIMQNTPIEFKDSYLRNFSYDDYCNNRAYLPINYQKRADHFYEEMKRVKDGIILFEKGDLESFGKLVFESGTSSINKYQTGSEQLETLHNIAMETKGIYGGRFSGAGFNGYYMALIDPLKKEEIIENVKVKYLKKYPQYTGKFNIEICDTSDGVNI